MIETSGYLRKPDWLKISLNTNENYKSLKRIMNRQHLNTVCEQARCPNIHECWGKYRTAIFMILGNICTRSCRFCAIKSGIPEAVDRHEPERVAESVIELGLKHVVITMVTRDDLKDGGASVISESVIKIREFNSDCSIEVLSSL